MTYRFEVGDDGRVTSVTMVSEGRAPDGALERGTPLSEDERDALRAGRLYFLAGEAKIVPEPEPSDWPIPDPRRAAVAAALPDILLAVADGAELRAEVRKVIEQLEVRHGSER